jgi:hypothetical protein
LPGFLLGKAKQRHPVLGVIAAAGTNPGVAYQTQNRHTPAACIAVKFTTMIIF